MVTLTVGKNSYGTLAEVDAYLDGSIRASSTWLGVAPDDKRRSMIEAYRQIEAEVFLGAAAGVTIVDLASINAGGTGYAKGDTLTVSGGTAGEPATAEVLAVASGVVTSVSLLNAGTYSASPSSPASTTTDGSGTGCTLTLTFAAQVSDFPRTGLVDCDGDAVGETAYPKDIKEAQYNLAFEMSQDPESAASAGQGSNVKSVGAGSAKVEFFRPESNTIRFPVQVQSLLKCYLAGSTALSMIGGFRGGADNPSTFDTYPADFDLDRGY